uniref:Uncharacterized protein n=1 Tax=Euplotes crassus TaxID=5936 RepID=A0A7S3KPT8_EUPCR|mmetsp:Transcript_38692/g.38240  ORF Transcript_38692/g.38240 Transcript_38692/m.38240 type:complete len:134 (+) Transcript_38692:114-515(+)
MDLKFVKKNLYSANFVKIPKISEKHLLKDFDTQKDCLSILKRIKTLELKVTYLLQNDPCYPSDPPDPPSKPLTNPALNASCSRLLQASSLPPLPSSLPLPVTQNQAPQLLPRMNPLFTSLRAQNYRYQNSDYL